MFTFTLLLYRDMPAQARRLVNRLKQDAHIDYEHDWKVITMFIGGNDLCDYCEDRVCLIIILTLMHVNILQCHCQLCTIFCHSLLFVCTCPMSKYVMYQLYDLCCNCYPSWKVNIHAQCNCHVLNINST
jgi:hypothetical protein